MPKQVRHDRHKEECRVKHGMTVKNEVFTLKNEVNGNIFEVVIKIFF